MKKFLKTVIMGTVLIIIINVLGTLLSTFFDRDITETKISMLIGIMAFLYIRVDGMENV